MARMAGTVVPTYGKLGAARAPKARLPRTHEQNVITRDSGRLAQRQELARQSKQEEEALYPQLGKPAQASLGK